MKLDDKTRRVLENFATIKPQIRFVPGDVVGTMTDGMSIVARARVSNPIDTEFAIWDLPQFLGVARLFSDPEIAVAEGRVTLTEGSKRAHYTCASLELPQVKPPPMKDVPLTPDASFELTAQLLKQVRDAAGVLRSEDVVVSGSNGELAIEATTVDNPTSDSYRVVVGRTDKTFRMAIARDNIRVIATDYSADVAFRGFLRLRSPDGGLEYFLAADQRKSVLT